MRLCQDEKLWSVFLEDDGTLDTVISVQPVAPRRLARMQEPEYFTKQQSRFDAENASSFRRRDSSSTPGGLRELSREEIEGYDLE